MIDERGYRPNVGIILANSEGRVLWARRLGQSGWQFPQGGIKRSETVEQALYRELDEEVGLAANQVQVIAKTRHWLRYKLPKHMRGSRSNFIGQKQQWFLLKMLAADDQIDINKADKPEFDFWRWVSYWYPLGQVVEFKQGVYRRALKELAPHLPRCMSEGLTG